MTFAILLSMYFLSHFPKLSTSFILLLLFTISALFCFESSNIYASSPHFVRHEIQDPGGINDLMYPNVTRQPDKTMAKYT